MEYKKAELQKEVEKLEAEMGAADFWSDKNKAQRIIRRIAELKAEIVSGGTSGKYDAGDAVMTIFSGAGGDDAEDFSTMLLNMYIKFCAKKSFGVTVLHQNENDHGGYRNVTIEISGKSAYGTLKNESGVHRLVRVSPFNAKNLRHTSFALVEVIPRFAKTGEIKIPADDLKIFLEEINHENRAIYFCESLHKRLTFLKGCRWNTRRVYRNVSRGKATKTL